MTTCRANRSPVATNTFSASHPCGPPAVLARLAAGEDVAASAYYFRTAPVFEVVDGPHGWLAENVFVATGERLARQVVIRVFLVG